MNIKDLLKTPKSLAVTIYLSTHKRWEETEQDRIELKNIIKTVEKKVKNKVKNEVKVNKPKDSEAKDSKAKDSKINEGKIKSKVKKKINIKKLLNPLYKILKDDQFWKKQQNTLVLFVSENIFEYLTLPEKISTQYFVGDNFDISLLPERVFNPVEYYILAVSLNKVRLFHVKNYSAEEIDPDLYPTSKEEALWMKEPGTNKAMIYHGHGDEDESQKEETLQYLHIIDEHINEIIKDKTKPLLVACVDYIFTLYKEANTYPSLIEDFIPGNPDNLSGSDLAERGSEFIK